MAPIHLLQPNQINLILPLALLNSLVIAKQKNVSEAARELSINVGDVLEVSAPSFSPFTQFLSHHILGGNNNNSIWFRLDKVQQDIAHLSTYTRG